MLPTFAPRSLPASSARNSGSRSTQPSTRSGGIGVVLQDLDDRANRAGNRQQSQPPVPTTRLGAHRVLLRFLPRRLMSAVGWYNHWDAGR